jgi:hypothetical protein
MSLIPQQLKSAFSRRLARSQNQFEDFGGERNLLSMLGFRSFIVQPVA